MSRNPQRLLCGEVLVSVRRQLCGTRTGQTSALGFRERIARSGSDWSAYVHWVGSIRPTCEYITGVCNWNRNGQILAGFMFEDSAGAGNHINVGRFTVPEVQCAKGETSASSDWVGLGGSHQQSGSSNVETLYQARINANCDKSNPKYLAFEQSYGNTNRNHESPLMPASSYSGRARRLPVHRRILRHVEQGTERGHLDNERFSKGVG